MKDNPQLGIFLRETALDNLEAGHDHEWVEAMVGLAIKALRLPDKDFTSDDLWREAEYVLHPPKEERAMGAVMRRLQRLKVAKPTNEMRPSTRAICHRRRQTVWVWL